MEANEIGNRILQFLAARPAFPTRFKMRSNQFLINRGQFSFNLEELLLVGKMRIRIVHRLNVGQSTRCARAIGPLKGTRRRGTYPEPQRSRDSASLRPAEKDNDDPVPAR